MPHESPNYNKQSLPVATRFISVELVVCLQRDSILRKVRLPLYSTGRDRWRCRTCWVALPSLWDFCRKQLRAKLVMSCEVFGIIWPKKAQNTAWLSARRYWKAHRALILRNLSRIAEGSSSCRLEWQARPLGAELCCAILLLVPNLFLPS